MLKWFGSSSPSWQGKLASVLLWAVIVALGGGPTLGDRPLPLHGPRILPGQRGVQSSHFKKAFDGVETAGLIKDQRLWKFKGELFC